MWKQKAWFNAQLSVISFCIPLYVNTCCYQVLLFVTQLCFLEVWVLTEKKPLAVPSKRLEEIHLLRFGEIVNDRILRSVLYYGSKFYTKYSLHPQQSSLFVVGPLWFYYSYSLQNHSQTVLDWNILFFWRTIPSVFL